MLYPEESSERSVLRSKVPPAGQGFREWRENHSERTWIGWRYDNELDIAQFSESIARVGPAKCTAPNSVYNQLLCNGFSQAKTYFKTENSVGQGFRQW
jgi:hypothetical protein